MDLLIYSIDGQKYGLDVRHVKSATFAAEVTPLPHCPDAILGAVNVHGQIIPVVNLRKVLGLPSRDLEASDQFVIYTLKNKDFALLIDGIDAVKPFKNEQLIAAHEVLPEAEGLEYVLKENNTFILLYNLEKLLDFCHET